MPFIKSVIPTVATKIMTKISSNKYKIIFLIFVVLSKGFNCRGVKFFSSILFYKNHKLSNYFISIFDLFTSKFIYLLKLKLINSCIHSKYHYLSISVLCINIYDLRFTSNLLEPPRGIEPRTNRLRSECSTPELRWQNSF